MKPTESQIRWLVKRICDRTVLDFDTVWNKIASLEIEEYTRLVAISYNDMETLKYEIIK